MKPAAIAQLVFIALSALAVYLFVTAAQDGEARATCTALCALGPQYANVDRAAPDFELADLSGKKVRLSSYRGTTVILNFWTKTCRPCLEEMPTIDELAEVLKNEGLGELITISTDQSADDARETLRTVLGHEPRFTTLVDPESNVVNGKFGTKLFPETWFIDPRGVIRVRVDGGRDWSSSLVLDVARMVARPNGCTIAFDHGKPRGDRFAVCGDAPGGHVMATAPRIAVFCGSAPGTDPAFMHLARQLGVRLAERDLGLVYGGASVGLMGAVADGAISAGGEVVGVLPQSLMKREIAHPRLTEFHLVDSMHARKALMADRASALGDSCPTAPRERSLQ